MCPLRSPSLLSNTGNYSPLITGIHFYLPFFLLTQINIIFNFERKKAPRPNTPQIPIPIHLHFGAPLRAKKISFTQQSTLLSLLPPVHLSLLSSRRSIFLLLLGSLDHTKYSQSKSNTPCLRD